MSIARSREWISLATATNGTDADLSVGALLHDTLEDCRIGQRALAEEFGDRVARILADNSDDMTLSKSERQERRIAAMAHKAPDNRMIKIADAISNMRTVPNSAPTGSTANRKLEYLQGRGDPVDVGRGVNAAFEALFDGTPAEVEGQIHATADTDRGDVSQALRYLDNAIGPAVHLVYLANARAEDFADMHMAQFAEAIAERFPAVAVQDGKAIHDGVLRTVSIARIRPDEGDAIVSLAQHLCMVFDQSSVGIEVGGRYIRVYSDDTGSPVACSARTVDP